MSSLLLRRFRVENKRDKCYRPYFTSYTQLPAFLCNCRTEGVTRTFYARQNCDDELNEQSTDSRGVHNEYRRRLFRRWERAKREARREFEYANHKFQTMSTLLLHEYVTNRNNNVGVTRECVLRMLDECTKKRLIYLDGIDRRYLEEEVRLFDRACDCESWQQRDTSDYEPWQRDSDYYPIDEE